MNYIKEKIIADVRSGVDKISSCLFPYEIEIIADVVIVGYDYSNQDLLCQLSGLTVPLLESSDSLHTIDTANMEVSI